MEQLSNDREDHPNWHKNGHKLCNEMSPAVMNQLESQWKRRQEHDQNLKAIVEQILAQKKEINPKKRDYKIHSLGSKQKN